MQNKYEYKGIFYAKNDSNHKYYEGGAHFKYIDLYNILKTLSKKKSLSKTKKDIKKNSLSQGKNNPNSNNNALSISKSKNKSSKNLLISENKTPMNFLINFHKKKIINNNEENKSLSKSKNLNNSHNYNKVSNLGITQFLNLKINKNLYNISDLENNSKLSNISGLKEKKISYDNLNIKHQPKSRNSQDKRIRTKTKKDNSSCLVGNNIYDYNNNNYNYFFLEQKIDNIKEKQKNTTNNKYRKLINSQNTNNYLDYFKITKITPRSRGSLNKNTVMLNIRKLKNKNIIKKTIYNFKDNSMSNITNITNNSFIKKKKDRLSFDRNTKISKIGYKFTSNTSNTTTADDPNIKNKNKNKKNNLKNNNKSPISNDSLYKKRNNMALLTVNKFDESLYKKYSKIINNNNKINNVNNNKVLKYINQYIIKSNGLKRQNSRNNFYCSYRNKYILNDLPKKITDNTYNNVNALKKNKNNEMNININNNQIKIPCKMSSRNSIINNEKILKSLEDR